MSFPRSVLKAPKQFAIILATAIVLCAVGSAYAISFGGPGGKWPSTWPKELEPFRKQAWTWEHGFGGMSYDIPFASRKDFEAAWPHILKLKSKGASVTLRRGPHLRVDDDKQSAGVCVRPLHNGTATVTHLMLVVDGAIVDLNRIPLPPDTPVMDLRFEDKK